MNALDLHEAEAEVKIIIEGQSVTLVPVFEKESNHFYKRAKEAGIIAGICLACSKVLGVYDDNLGSGLAMLDDNLGSGLAMLDDMNGHVGMKKYIEEGYQVISM